LRLPRSPQRSPILTEPSAVQTRTIPAKQFRAPQLEQELATADYSPTTINDIIAAVQGTLNWAVASDLLDANPLTGYTKPRPRRRTRILARKEFQSLLREADVNFRRVLISLRLTGCRPGEVRKLMWEWVDLDRALWIMADHKTVTQQRESRPRVVPLPMPILKLCTFLARKPHEPTDHVFVNMHGRPYTKDCFVRKIDRLRERAGIEMKSGERIVLYSCRHTFGTEIAGKVSDIELAELMGHTEVRTTHRYVHLNADRLHDIRRRAHG
jgi:integrase